MANDEELSRLSDRLIHLMQSQQRWPQDLSILVILLERVRDDLGWTPLEFAIESARRALVRGAEIEGIVERDDKRPMPTLPMTMRRMASLGAKVKHLQDVVAEERRKHDLDLLEKQQEIVQLREELDRRDRIDAVREQVAEQERILREEDQARRDRESSWPGAGAG